MHQTEIVFKNDTDCEMNQYAKANGCITTAQVIQITRITSNSEEPLEIMEFADEMDENRILNAFFHRVSRSESRMRILFMFFASPLSAESRAGGFLFSISHSCNTRAKYCEKNRCQRALDVEKTDAYPPNGRAFQIMHHPV